MNLRGSVVSQTLDDVGECFVISGRRIDKEKTYSEGSCPHVSKAASTLFLLLAPCSAVQRQERAAPALRLPRFEQKVEDDRKGRGQAGHEGRHDR